MAGMCSETNQHLLNAIDKFNEHVSNEDTVTLETIRETSCRQKMLSNKLENSLFAQLFSKSSLPDRARLLSVSSPHAAAWLSTAPSPGLNIDRTRIYAGIYAWRKHMALRDTIFCRLRNKLDRKYAHSRI